MNKTPILEIKDLQATINENEILKNLNLKVHKGEIHAIMGPNGSGKSTLLGLLSGVFYSESGTVYANCEKFGYIGATPLIFDSSLRENILYGNQVNVTDEEILKELRLFNTFKEESSYNLDRKVDNKSLSSGQMQKIAFMRVLLSDADTLFLDESTSNLDEETKALVFDLLSNTDLTIINSTHDIDSFKNYTHHFKIELSKGKRLLKKVV
mgnify:CR=1 FL=1